MWQVKKEYEGKTACFGERVILLKNVSKKDMKFLIKKGYEGIEYVEKDKE